MALRTKPVFAPNLGLYLDRPPLAIPLRGLKEPSRNVRVRDGVLVRDNLGWGPFPNASSPVNLSGDPVTGIDNFFPREGGQFLLFGTTKDLYRYDEGTQTVVLLTPRYTTGTVSVTNASTTVTGSGTAWLTEAKAGDRIHIGTADETDPTETWYDVAAIVSDTELTLSIPYAGTTGSGLDYTLRQSFTGGILDPWLFETFPNAADVQVGADGDRWYATNGRDPVVAWTNALTQVYLPNLGIDTAQWIRRISNVMVYGHITVASERKPFSIRTSDIGKPEETTGVGHSIELVVHDGVDPLINAFPLGEMLVIYGERSVTLAQFVGLPLVFVFRRAIHGVGPLSSRAIADYGDHHTFLGNDAQYRFDGVRIDEIGSHVFRDTIRRHAPQRQALIHAHFDEEQGELLWVMPLNVDADPETGPPETAIVEHYLENSETRDPTPFTVRDLPSLATGFFEREVTLTWDQLSQQWQELNFRWDDQFLQAAFPFNLFGTIDGDIFILNAQDSQNGAGFTATARFGRRPLGDIRTKGLIRRLYPFVRQIEGQIDIYLHLARDPAGPTTQHGPFPFDMSLTGPNHFISPRLVNRYVEVEFRTEGVSKPFFVEGYDLDLTGAGER